MRVCGRGMRVWREGMRARSMRRGSGGERRASSVERRASRRGEGEGEGETKSRVPRHPAELTCTSRCPCWRRRRAHVAAQDSSKRLAAGRCDATPLDALRAPAVPVPSPSSRRHNSTRSKRSSCPTRNKTAPAQTVSTATRKVQARGEAMGSEATTPPQPQPSKPS